MFQGLKELQKSSSSVKALKIRGWWMEVHNNKEANMKLIGMIQACISGVVFYLQLLSSTFVIWCVCLYVCLCLCVWEDSSRMGWLSQFAHFTWKVPLLFLTTYDIWLYRTAGVVLKHTHISISKQREQQKLLLFIFLISCILLSC